MIPTLQKVEQNEYEESKQQGQQQDKEKNFEQEFYKILLYKNQDKQIIPIIVQDIYEKGDQLSEFLLSDAKDLVLSDFMNDKDSSMDNIILLGESGVGKSTMINYLAGVELEAIKDGRKVLIKTKGEPVAQIGLSLNSETSLPKKIQINQQNFWDIPGLFDNRGVNQEIMNAFFLRKIVQNLSKLKILFLIDDSTFEAARSTQLENLLIKIDALFSSCKEVFQDALTIVVTKFNMNEKIDRNEQIDGLKQEFFKFLDSMNNFKNKDLIKNLLNERFSVFSKLNVGQLAQSEERFLIQKQIDRSKPVKGELINIDQIMSQQCSEEILKSFDMTFKNLTNLYYQLFNGIILQFQSFCQDEQNEDNLVNELKNLVSNKFENMMQRINNIEDMIQELEQYTYKDKENFQFIKKLFETLKLIIKKEFQQIQFDKQRHSNYMEGLIQTLHKTIKTRQEKVSYNKSLKKIKLMEKEEQDLQSKLENNRKELQQNDKNFNEKIFDLEKAKLELSQLSNNSTNKDSIHVQQKGDDIKKILDQIQKEYQIRLDSIDQQYQRIIDQQQQNAKHKQNKQIKLQTKRQQYNQAKQQQQQCYATVTAGGGGPPQDPNNASGFIAIVAALVSGIVCKLFW